MIVITVYGPANEWSYEDNCARCQVGRGLAQMFPLKVRHCTIVDETFREKVKHVTLCSDCIRAAKKDKQVRIVEK